MTTTYMQSGNGFDISVSVQKIDLKGLFDRYANSRLSIEEPSYNPINPWTIEEKSRFIIESLVMPIVPRLYFNQMGNGVWVPLVGEIQQKISTLIEFMRGDFRLTIPEDANVEGKINLFRELNGQDFGELSLRVKNILRDSMSESYLVDSRSDNVQVQALANNVQRFG